MTLRAILLDPQGNEHEMHGLREFSEKHGLTPSALSELCSSKKNRTHHKGWKFVRLIGNDEDSPKTPYYTNPAKNMVFNLDKRKRREARLFQAMYESKPTGETFNGG